MSPRTTGLSRRSALALGLAAPLGLPALASAAPLAVTDALGRTISLSGPAQRIVISFNFEEFTAVTGTAGWDRVVGFNRRQWEVNRSSNWIRYQAAIPRLKDLVDVGAGENNSFSVERVLSLRPDLVIVLALEYTALATAMAQIEAAGIPVMTVDYNAQRLDRHVASTLALGHATGSTDRAQALVDLYRSRVADIARRVEGLPKLRVYVELGQAGPGTFGNSYNDVMWGRMTQLAEGANIAAGRIPVGFHPMAPESVLAAAPEFVFITGSSWAGSPNAVRAGYGVDIETTRRTLAPYAARPGWAQLPAIQAGNLYAIETGLSRSLWDWTGTEYIAKQLHPAAFADVDPVADLRRYHEQFLPVAFDGTWMARLTAQSA